MSDWEGLAAEFDFPVDEYLRGQIRDGRTLTRKGSWWSAVLLMEDPRSGKPYVAMYRWHRKDGQWKRASKFTCRTSRDVDTLRDFLAEQRDKLR